MFGNRPTAGRAEGSDAVKFEQTGAGGSEQCPEFLVRPLSAGVLPPEVADQLGGEPRRVLSTRARGHSFLARPSTVTIGAVMSRASRAWCSAVDPASVSLPQCNEVRRAAQGSDRLVSQLQVVGRRPGLRGARALALSATAGGDAMTSRPSTARSLPYSNPTFSSGRL